MRKWLYDLRNSKGYTMKEIAEKLDISESYYCLIEKGERQKNMDMTVVAKLSVLFGLPISRIFACERENFAEEKELSSQQLHNFTKDVR